MVEQNRIWEIAEPQRRPPPMIGLRLDRTPAWPPRPAGVRLLVLAPATFMRGTERLPNLGVNSLEKTAKEIFMTNTNYNSPNDPNRRPVVDNGWSGATVGAMIVAGVIALGAIFWAMSGNHDTASTNTVPPTTTGQRTVPPVAPPAKAPNARAPESK